MQRDAAAIMTMPPETSTATAVFTRVEVFHEASAVLDVWAELETMTSCSIYQTRAWLLPWTDTLGKRAGLQPLFIVARGRNDRPIALLTLGTIRRGPLRVATWLGERDSNFNMPLACSDVTWTPMELRRLLSEAAKACGRGRPDFYHLANQPFEWGGRANPLALLEHQESPSAAYGTRLPLDAEAFFAAKLSKDTRKKLRKKEAKLAAVGPVTHLVVADADAQRRVIDCFIAQRLARFRSQKIVSMFDAPEMRSFIEAASRPRGNGIELHALLAGERIVAIYGGGAHGRQWSGMFNAFDTDKEIARSSPGDLLLTRIVAKACADGIMSFDLGIGEARYKTALCDRIALFDTVVPVSAAGMVAAGVVAARQKAKRFIKARPKLFALAKKIAALRT